MGQPLGGSDHRQRVSFYLNGRQVSAVVPTSMLLVDLLREKLRLTGTKQGCGIGECGACTVLVDGMPVNSCLVLAVSVAGKTVITVEGLNDDPKARLIQEVLVECGAIQCGFCTPGMVVSLWALLNSNPCPSREDVVQAICGNLCRCTGYAKIIQAALVAAARMGCASVPDDLANCY